MPLHLPLPLSPGLLVISTIVLCAAALHDIAARSVPNWMPAVLALVGLVAQLLHGRPFAGLVAALVVFVLAQFCWRRGWLGGGDVKLLGATTLLVKPGEVVDFILAVTVIGAGLAIAYIAASRVIAAPAACRPAGLIARTIRVERWRVRRGGPLPYACAVAAGFAFTSVRSSW